MWIIILTKILTRVIYILNMAYIVNIKKDTLENKNFRKVLYTAKNSQLVVMSLLPKEEIGAELKKAAANQY